MTDSADFEAQIRMVEAMLFAAADPVSVADLTARAPAGCDVAAALTALQERYAGRGVVVARVGSKWAIRTAPDLAFLFRREITTPRRLSKAAVETLAIIAYHQPATRAEIEEIRGVGVSGGVIDTLMEIGWIKMGRRRESPGRPATFVTTDGFLDHFGLENVRDLPGLAELKAAGVLDNRPPPDGAALFDPVALAFGDDADPPELEDDQEDDLEEEEPL